MLKLESILIKYFKYLDRKGSRFNTAVGVVCIILVVLLDTYSPAGYEFQFLYLLPIAFTTWFAGMRAGFLISMICTSYLTRYHYIEPLDVAVWNILSVFGIFCVVIIMVFKIRELLEIKNNLSRSDSLTGVINLRAFREIAEYEILRSRREGHPLSVAFLDIDDFKKVNDHYGHGKGDELLKAVVACISQNIRKTDVIARMGGDEFTILFPATDQKSVKVVTQKVTEELNELSNINNWPTTVSMGVVTCTNGACKLDDIISKADRLMYEVKKAGKNNINYAMWQKNENQV